VVPIPGGQKIFLHLETSILAPGLTQTYIVPVALLSGVKQLVDETDRSPESANIKCQAVCAFLHRLRGMHRGTFTFHLST
jgi:hypothetical protein